jgi:hypothetical protein
MRKLIILGLLAAPLALGTGYAQTTTPSPAAKAATAKPKPSPTAKTAASIECAKRADEKKLRGKERTEFRARCRKEELAKKKE